MTDVPLIDQIAERVERLLVRHDELMRTNAILREQVAALTHERDSLKHERDSLKSRLMAARARVDELIDRLPANQGAAEDAAGMGDGAPPRKEDTP